MYTNYKYTYRNEVVVDFVDSKMVVQEQELVDWTEILLFSVALVLLYDLVLFDSKQLIVVGNFHWNDSLAHDSLQKILVHFERVHQLYNKINLVFIRNKSLHSFYDKI